nr:hypothetical protein CFP56_65099 [Quercus suber]
MWVLYRICIESVLFVRNGGTVPEELDRGAMEFGEGALKRVEETCCWVELTTRICIESVLFVRNGGTVPEELDRGAMEFGEGALKRVEETCCWVELTTRCKSHSSSSTLELSHQSKQQNPSS